MLYFVVMTAGKKYTLGTALFYTLFLLLMPLAEHVAPSGPCVPGGGILLLMLTPVISGLGLFVCLVARLKGHRSFLGPVLINGMILLGSLLLFNWHLFV